MGPFQEGCPLNQRQCSLETGLDGPGLTPGAEQAEETNP